MVDESDGVLGDPRQALIHGIRCDAKMFLDHRPARKGQRLEHRIKDGDDHREFRPRLAAHHGDTLPESGEKAPARIQTRQAQPVIWLADHGLRNPATADGVSPPVVPQTVVGQLIGRRRADLDQVAVEPGLKIQRRPAQRTRVLIGDRVVLPEQHRNLRARCSR